MAEIIKKDNKFYIRTYRDIETTLEELEAQKAKIEPDAQRKLTEINNLIDQIKVL